MERDTYTAFTFDLKLLEQMPPLPEQWGGIRKITKLPTSDPFIVRQERGWSMIEPRREFFRPWRKKLKIVSQRESDTETIFVIRGS